MAFNWDNYKDHNWFGTSRQELLTEMYHKGYISGEDGSSETNPFDALPKDSPLLADPDLVDGLRKAFNEGRVDGHQVKENRELHHLK